MLFISHGLSRAIGKTESNTPRAGSRRGVSKEPRGGVAGAGIQDGEEKKKKAGTIAQTKEDKADGANGEKSGETDVKKMDD